MSTSRRIAFALSVSWTSKAAAIGASLLLVPMLFRYMSKEELGLWYLLGNSQAFLGLLGFGIAPILTRHIAFLNRTCNVDPDAKLSLDERQQLSDLLATGRTVLHWMGAATFVVAWVSGYFLVRKIPLHSVSWNYVLCAWTLMCVGYALNVWFSYLDCWVAGIGYVGWDTLIAATIGSSTTIAYIVAVLLGGGLLSLAAISVSSVVVQRFVFIQFLRRRQADVSMLAGKWSASQARELVSPSLRLWITTLGAFLLYKTDQYFIAYFQGTTQVALYQATYNTIFVLSSIAVTYANTAAVFVSQLWAESRLEEIHRQLVRSCRMGFLVMIAGTVFLALAGRQFFQIWLHGSFIGYPVLTVLLITLCLDTQHILLTSVSRATNDEKYAVPAITAGLLNLGFTWFLVQRLGLVGVPLGTLLAQVLTNNWYAVYRPLVRLRYPFARYFRQVLLPSATVAVATIVLGLIARHMVADRSRLVVCSSLLVVCGVTGLLGFGLLVFRRTIQASPAAISNVSRAYAARRAE